MNQYDEQEEYESDGMGCFMFFFALMMVLGVIGFAVID